MIRRLHFLMVCIQILKSGCVVCFKSTAFYCSDIIYIQIDDLVRQGLTAAKILTSITTEYGNIHKIVPNQRTIEARASYVRSKPEHYVETVQQLAAFIDAHKVLFL